MLHSNLRGDPHLVFVFWHRATQRPTKSDVQGDKATGLPKRLTGNKGQQDCRAAQRRDKKRTRGRPTLKTQPTRGMSLKQDPERTSSSEQEVEEQSSTTSEKSAPSPKWLNQKRTPPNSNRRKLPLNLCKRTREFCTHKHNWWKERLYKKTIQLNIDSLPGKTQKTRFKIVDTRNGINRQNTGISGLREIPWGDQS